jgi:hypothetical protein
LNTVFDGYYKYKNLKYPRVLCKDCKKRHIIKTAPISSNISSGGDELLESFKMPISSQATSTLVEGSETT